MLRHDAACVAHCCPVHGCKYSELNCPVWGRKALPLYPYNNGCEECETYVSETLNKLGIEARVVDERLDGYCSFCGGEGHLARECTALHDEPVDKPRLTALLTSDPEWFLEQMQARTPDAAKWARENLSASLDARIIPVEQSPKTMQSEFAGAILEALTAINDELAESVKVLAELTRRVDELSARMDA